MTSIRRHILLASGLVALAPVVRAQTTTTTPAGVPVRRLSNSEYMTQTMMAGTLAKQTSQLALSRGRHPAVQQFAAFEVAEQTTIAQVLTDTRDPPPVPLDAEHASVLRTLEAVPAGPQFDRAYVLGQVQGHNELLAIQQGYLESTTRTTDGQHIAALARTMIQEHLTLLQDIQRLLAQG